MAKAPHHTGTHQANARRTTDAANRNPNTRCCNCGNTLDQCGPNRDGRNGNGTPCTWDAGHPDGRWQGTDLRAECSWCNRSRGGQTGARTRSTGYTWP